LRERREKETFNSNFDAIIGALVPKPGFQEHESGASHQAFQDLASSAFEKIHKILKIFDNDDVLQDLVLI
jgi:hypothetical protein